MTENVQINQQASGYPDPSRELVLEVRAMREQLIRMDERMNMVQDHESRLRTLEGYQLSDLDGRTRSLEKWRYMLPTSAVLAFGSVIATVISIFGK